ncbi:MAG: DUF4335 domain-containing protein [Nostocaceae cyanobacterium]|nr:DUF4335 domain-containing protein [Nostocaceae cyanobacterium]
MNIQRKYSLPNCTLLLEGISDPNNAAAAMDMRPLLSFLLNAECYLSSLTQPLTGDRAFFESLVKAVSGYAQEFLSKIPHSEAHNEESSLVKLQKIDNNRHRLIVYSGGQVQSGQIRPNTAQAPIQVDLTTVQLFDLVEAVDQFFADSQTLPDLVIPLQPVSKRYVAGSGAVSKQVVPATVGVSALAGAAAAAFFLVPVPEVRPPQPKTQEPATSSETTVSPTTAANSTTTATPTPTQAEASQSAETTPTTAATAPPTTEASQSAETTPTTAATAPPTTEASQSAETTPTTEATATPTTAASPPSVTELEAVFNSSNEITVDSEVRQLNGKLRDEVDKTWSKDTRKSLDEDLVFRVAVTGDGTVIGYKAVSKTANDSVSKTPLPQLLYNPATRNNLNSEPIAQYRVVFTNKGVVQVSPWWGYGRKTSR